MFRSTEPCRTALQSLHSASSSRIGGRERVHVSIRARKWYLLTSLSLNWGCVRSLQSPQWLHRDTVCSYTPSLDSSHGHIWSGGGQIRSQTAQITGGVLDEIIWNVSRQSIQNKCPSAGGTKKRAYRPSRGCHRCSYCVPKTEPAGLASENETLNEVGVVFLWTFLCYKGDYEIVDALARR